MENPGSTDINGTEYTYDANGETVIYYLYDENGQLVVQYAYDAWGKPLSVTGALANTIGQINPIRYRGYYYDNETGFYYLQSRYYDPETGRFINADSQLNVKDLNGYNMFSYCSNNPVNNIDPDGHSWKSSKNWFKSKIISAKKSIAKVSQWTNKNILALEVGPHFTGYDNEKPSEFTFYQVKDTITLFSLGGAFFYGFNFSVNVDYLYVYDCMVKIFD